MLSVESNVLGISQAVEKNFVISRRYLRELFGQRRTHSEDKTDAGLRDPSSHAEPERHGLFLNSLPVSLFCRK